MLPNELEVTREDGGGNTLSIVRHRINTKRSATSQCKERERYPYRENHFLKTRLSLHLAWHACNKQVATNY